MIMIIETFKPVGNGYGDGHGDGYDVGYGDCKVYGGGNDNCIGPLHGRGSGYGYICGGGYGIGTVSNTPRRRRGVKIGISTAIANKTIMDTAVAIIPAIIQVMDTGVSVASAIFDMFKPVGSGYGYGKGYGRGYVCCNSYGDGYGNGYACDDGYGNGYGNGYGYCGGDGYGGGYGTVSNNPRKRRVK